MRILVLNSGSSSQKSALFRLSEEMSEEPVAPLWQGKLDWDGKQESLTVRAGQHDELAEKREVPPEQRHRSVGRMLGLLWTGRTAVVRDPGEISMVGHRIVHGGAKLAEPVVIDDQVKRDILEVSEIAPLHNKAGLEGITLAEELFPNRVQVAVFDTGFHRTLPKAAAIYPGPYQWCERGIRRYGFHGINHQYLARRAAQLLHRDLASLKVVTCHLGNGCSLAAVDEGKSIDTTMGFTPLEGLMMGTRSGSIDPGILIHLLRTDRLTADGLNDLLNHDSGLAGISGISGDMRDIQRAMGPGNEHSERARLAFDIFVHRLRSGIAVMSASLGGFDALIFSAGIGENAPQVRAAACARLGFLGIRVDETRNVSAKGDVEISSTDSKVHVFVIRAQEEWAIARACARLLRSR